MNNDPRPDLKTGDVVVIKGWIPQPFTITTMVKELARLAEVLKALCKARAHQADTGDPIPPELWSDARTVLDEMIVP